MVTMQMKAHKLGWHRVRTVLDKSTGTVRKICGKVRPDTVFTYDGPLEKAPFGWAEPVDPEQRAEWQAMKDKLEDDRANKRRAIALVGAEALARNEAEIESRIVARLKAQGLLVDPGEAAKSLTPVPAPAAEPTADEHDGLVHKGGPNYTITVNGVTESFRGKKVDAQARFEELMDEASASVE